MFVLIAWKEERRECRGVFEGEKAELIGQHDSRFSADLNFLLDAVEQKINLINTDEENSWEQTISSKCIKIKQLGQDEMELTATT